MRCLPLCLPLFALAACGGSEDAPSRWSELARGYEPAGLPDLSAWESRGFRLRQAAEGELAGGVWLGAEIERSAWRELGVPGLWHAQRPVGNSDWFLRASSSIRASAAGEEYEHFAWTLALDDPNAVPPGTFSVVVDRVYLRLEPGESPPESVLYEAFVPRGVLEEGRWRIDFGRWVGDGFPCWSGEAVELEIQLAAGRELLLSSASISPVAHPSLDGPAEGEVRFRVELDGELLLDHPQSASHLGQVERHRLPLPAQGAGRLRLSVEGDPALAAFLSPVVAPAQRGRPGARPWADDRPDLVLFLADTFRADNMSAYGGELELTPNLDAFAARSVLFQRSWSPAIWTLPSQASMFSAAYPPQHGAIRELNAVPESVETLAERLRAAGYRTGAITDAGLVSRRNGFDQGFEWFDERFRQEFDETLDEVRAFLDADDGRPSFLFVQTYRAHRPYRVSAETRAVHGARLGIEGEWEQVFAGVDKEKYGWEQEQPLPPALRAAVERLQAHYHGGVIDLDRGFQQFLDLLEARGLLDSGFLAFTSDHGESFGEHDTLWHQGGVWEELLRVPLFLHGPGLDGAVVERAASLVDLPRTFAALSGVEPASAWGGVDLLSETADRPALGFECPSEGVGRMAIIAGAHKLHLPAVSEELAREHVLHAFDLARDAREREGMGAEASWIATLLEGARGYAQRAMRAQFEASAADLGHYDEELLRALGYNGD